ncbi:hypothetical protein FOMPIDRAFT_82645 [Fomitopsis schrenkii]|uniref:Ricin B lectin domain-containing protein n=1 Tax=Fomitopsis schrenkii TaxID=2126942 RepID=S8FMD4_FOMSC|nr:hypothetical protein FOMPIDRAFT_82645 [Fomitopsis schrenkii]
MHISTNPPPAGVYFIQNIATKTVLELAGGSNANSTSIYASQQRNFSDELVPAQLWVISQDGTGNSAFKIENANSRTIMDLSAADSADGTPIIGYQSTGGSNQRWAILRTNSIATTYVIQNQATGMIIHHQAYIDLLNGSSANGTAINGWSGRGVDTTNTHQLWTLIAA